jgi:hypothetical protein
MSGLLVFVGLGQIAPALASLCLPRILRWREDAARLQPLTWRVFWVHACYILGTNLCLGGLSAVGPHLLLDRSPLARVVAGYGALYRGARLAIRRTGSVSRLRKGAATRSPISGRNTQRLVRVVTCVVNCPDAP